ncbi:hypothetical protein K432DRAFT_382826 [Lepidopterella palustris CBS 459.81]|uniref:Uncharacterized protein n=1 Tax=Lepidopterella palustris CBS 459.81 TaxID=1314670 RepID=A0A8E2E9E9_9PEZI|nr:hypothetical protein K432DRAFT_382826 [Lepidopterella palustris CBS 459.81]
MAHHITSLDQKSSEQLLYHHFPYPTISVSLPFIYFHFYQQQKHRVGMYRNSISHYSWPTVNETCGYQ